MRKSKLLFVLSISTLALAACAPTADKVASTAPPPTWAFEKSDVPVDPGYRFGKLPNGMRYVIRANATPKGTASVRFQIKAGSIDESDDERGYAHFLEHMAFNGSTNVPEGEMVKLLERNGLAFGADTNAETGFVHTAYKLDLPRADPALLDTALMLMRETATELTISAEAVNRERGVLLAELRDRDTFAQRNAMDGMEFGLPGSRLTRRWIGGTRESLEAATPEKLRAYWRREYVPAHATLFVIGDFDPDQVEARLRERFASWQPALAEPQPGSGPIDPRDKDRSDIYIDPALSESVAIFRNGTWLDEGDSLAQRRERTLRMVGYAIINRRLLRISREKDAPFRSASFGTNTVFRDGRSTELSVSTVDGKWRRGVVAAGTEYHRAMAYGFTPEEVSEQVAALRTANRNAARAQDTRSHSQLMGAAIALVSDEIVPDTPANSAERFEQFAAEITPEAVLAALKREALPLDEPLIRLQGRVPPDGGEAGLRSAWSEAMAAPIAPPERRAAAVFAYTDFGLPGKVVSDSRESSLGIRQIRFANGVRLNLKRTDLRQNQVLVQVSVDGGQMLNTRENPLATNMIGALAQGGLGKHSKDELDTIMAGHAVSANFSATEQTFVSAAATTPDDLELQLQYVAALMTDPGYRPEGEVRYMQTINNLFASLRATPGSALVADQGAILSDGDPRFSFGKVEDYRALSFAKLRDTLGDRLKNGAIEIGIVGDIDEETAIALVARTFGALPQREAEFRAYDDRRTRPFTRDRKPRTLRHTGPRDQALINTVWPTRDGEDPVAEVGLEVLQRVLQIAITDNLREKLGKAYSPAVGGVTSRTWRGWGVLGINATVGVADVPATRAAIAETVAELLGRPVSDDVLLRAKAPMLEGYDNALKSNSAWLSLVDRAQTEPDRIERYLAGKARVQAITTRDIQALARQYLGTGSGVEFIVLPEGVDPPMP
jgi:zinc protease